MSHSRTTERHVKQTSIFWINTLPPPVKGTGSRPCCEGSCEAAVCLLLGFVQEQRGAACLNLHLAPKSLALLMFSFAVATVLSVWYLRYLCSTQTSSTWQFFPPWYLYLYIHNPGACFVQRYWSTSGSCGFCCMRWCTNSVQKYLNYYLKFNLYKNLNKHQSEDWSWKLHINKPLTSVNK